MTNANVISKKSAKNYIVEYEDFKKENLYTNEEREAIRQKAISDGCIIEPLILWEGRNYLVYGYEELAIAKELALPYETKEIEFESEIDCMAWTWERKLAGPSLSSFQKTEVGLKFWQYWSGQDYTKVFLDSEDDEDGGGILKSSDNKSFIIPASMPDKEQVEYKDKDGDICLLTTDEVFNLPNNFIIERFVEMLDANPREISEIFIKMGREDLVGIIHLPKNYKRSKTKLSDMLEWYLTEEERSRDTIRYCKSFWEQFCEIVNVPYLEQISLNHIKVYKQQLKKIKTEKKLIP